MNRLRSMQELANNIEDVICLNGTTVTIDGITYGGAGMWYDLSGYHWAIQNHNYTIFGIFDE